MEVGPHRGTRGGKGPRARLYNTLQQIVVDEYKRQNRRFRWIRFADASKQQVEALFSWRESLDSWHLWNFDQEAFDVIQAADNAYQQRLALVETTGVVLPQGAPSQDQAAASGAAGASSSAADWLRPPTPPSASSWLQDSRTPLPRIRPSAEERQAARSTLRGVYAKAAETRRESSRERSTQRSRSPSPRRSRSPSTSPRRGPTAAAPVEQRAHSVEPALAREGRPSRTSLATRPIVLAPQNSIYPVTRFGYWCGRHHNHVKRLLVGERNGRLGSFAKPILISSLTRPGGTRQGGPPRAHAHGLLTAARRPRSTSASTRSARTRTHRKTRSPSGRAELHTCLGASTRRRLTPSPSRFTAEESGQFNRRPQRPLPMSSSAASHRCPRRSPRQFLQRLQRPTSRGSHRQGPDLRFGLRVHSGTKHLREA